MLNTLYPLLRPLLFRLPAETAHHLTLNTIKTLDKLGFEQLYRTHVPRSPQQWMGLTFPNPVGLAAGLDKDGAYIDALAALGFGFIEIGTVTPRPQPGNPSPRLFRVVKAQALINRMGFNNGGVDALLDYVQNARFVAQGGVLGINIGKNADTPIERADEDYLYCLEKVYPYASYITINISSPNTLNLRQLQSETALDSLLKKLRDRQQRLADQYHRYTPLVLKIAPDLTAEQIKIVAATLIRHKIDGVIATNTTTTRDGIQGMRHAKESGGLSGAPLLHPSNAVVSALRAELGSDFPIVGAGGILNAEGACRKRMAGANLIQLYTGLIYQGPQLIRACAQALAAESSKNIA